MTPPQSSMAQLVAVTFNFGVEDYLEFSIFQCTVYVVWRSILVNKLDITHNLEFSIFQRDRCTVCVVWLSILVNKLHVITHNVVEAL